MKRDSAESGKNLSDNPASNGQKAAKITLAAATRRPVVTSVTSVRHQAIIKTVSLAP
jgi:hypothetical protein